MAFADLAAGMLDIVYAEFGVAALWRPVDGADLAVTVVRKGADQDGLGLTGAVVEGERAAVRVAEVAEARSGDVLEIGAARFKVLSASRDPERLEWRLVLRAID